MKNDADNIYFGGDFCRSAFLLIAFLISFPVFSADGLPPTTMQQAIYKTPNGQSINGYDFGNGFRARIPDGAASGGGHYGKATYVGGEAGRIMHGTKKLNPIMTDAHGATARGQITTTTQISPAGTRAGALLLGASIVGSAANNQSNAIGTALADGRYSDAVQASVLGLLQAADITGLGKGYIGIQQAMSDAQKAKAQSVVGHIESNLGKDPVNVAGDDYKKYYVVSGGHANQAYDFQYLVLAKSPPAQWSGNFTKCADFRTGSFLQNLVNFANQNLVGVPSFVAAGPNYCQGFYPATAAHLQTLQLHYPAPQVTAEDLLLSQQEIADLLMAQMAANAENATAIINAIHTIGGIDQSQTTTTVDNGGTAQTTFLTAPYTPQGSNQAQQTQFVINKDGSVTATTIPRPDLAANTSQAPTRAPVGVEQTSPDTKPVKESATASAPDVCANNPNSLMCAPLGNMDYSDPVLPEKAINISLNPLNVFSTSGVCPNPLSFTLLHTNHQFSYETMCDVAAKARPWIIMLSMLFAFTLVYYALGFGQR